MNPVRVFVWFVVLPLALFTWAGAEIWVRREITIRDFTTKALEKQLEFHRPKKAERELPISVRRFVQENPGAAVQYRGHGTLYTVQAGQQSRFFFTQDE